MKEEIYLINPMRRGKELSRRGTTSIRGRGKIVLNFKFKKKRREVQNHREYKLLFGEKKEKVFLLLREKGGGRGVRNPSKG